MTERVLVTGATGCLGSNITSRLLEEGLDVAVLVPLGEHLGRLSPLRRDVEIRHGDVRDPGDIAKAVRGVGEVYHVAGIAVPSNRVERSMWEVNVFGVHNVMSAARSAGVRRVLHVSSTAAIGYPPDGVIAREDFDHQDSVADNAYSRTKRRGEQVALSFNGPDLEVVAVNPSAVIAPGGDRRFGWGGVVEAALKGLLRAMPGGGSAFCSADDLVSGVLGAMRRGKAGQRYILNSQNLTYRDLGALIADAVHVPGPIATVPGWALHMLARVNELVSSRGRVSVLVRENVELMTRRLFYDQSKAVRELGMSQTPLATAVTQVREWIQSEVHPHAHT